MYEYKIPPIDPDCGVTITQHVMGAKWKPYLINCMTRGIHRPAEFRRAIKGASRRGWYGSSASWNPRVSYGAWRTTPYR